MNKKAEMILYFTFHYLNPVNSSVERSESLIWRWLNEFNTFTSSACINPQFSHLVPLKSDSLTSCQLRFWPFEVKKRGREQWESRNYASPKGKYVFDVDTSPTADSCCFWCCFGNFAVHFISAMHLTLAMHAMGAQNIKIKINVDRTS